MINALISIHCIKCKTDIIFISDGGELEEEGGWISSNIDSTITIKCFKCDSEVEFR